MNCPGTDERFSSFHPSGRCFVCGYLREAHKDVSDLFCRPAVEQNGHDRILTNGDSK